MRINAQKVRRATVLLLVVTLLALLFVIVTGYLSLSRTNRAVTNEIQKSNLTDNIAKNISGIGISLIKDQILDNQGQILGAGTPNSLAREDIPGYRDTNYIAPLEPYWDLTIPIGYSYFGLAGNRQIIERIKWPSLTSLDRKVVLEWSGSGTPPSSLMQPFALYELLRDYNPNDTNPQIYPSDIDWNARIPFMDADGDGIPDSQPLLVASATEAANNMAGISVRLPRWGDGTNFKIWDLPTYSSMNGLNDEIWQQYYEKARYEVAMRVVSHGGMVTLDSPTLYYNSTAYPPFNRCFTLGMFDSCRCPDDPQMMKNMYRVILDQNRLFDELHANQSAVEQALRRRFLLPTPVFGDTGHNASTRIPPVLAELQGMGDSSHNGFPATFFPSFMSVTPENNAKNWQRFNLANVNNDSDNQTLIGWARAVAYSPKEYNVSVTPAGNQSSSTMSVYDHRHFMTTINNSDDLARRQNAQPHNPTAADPLGLDFNGARSALYDGELKFYLGEVEKAFVEDPPNSGQYVYDIKNGKVIVERLARLYHEMLGSHSKVTLPDGTSFNPTSRDWDNVTTSIPSTPDYKQAVSRRQQALMLAVNTVAFGAPRDRNILTAGRIPTVAYNDAQSSLTYIGYAPQPFITEVIAYNKDRDQDNDPPKIAIAVELYNPNDSYPDGSTNPPGDIFALDLTQFTLEVDEVNVGAQAVSLEACGTPEQPNRLPGRSFVTVVLKPSNSGENDYFNDRGTEKTIGEIPVTETNLTIRLRRLGKDPTSGAEISYVVDEIQLSMPTEIPSDADPHWQSKYRDTSTTIDPVTFLPMFGGNGKPNTEPDAVPYARWNMVMANETERGDGADNVPDKSTLNNAKWLVRPNIVDPDSYIGTGSSSDFAPIVPLITMNAAPSDIYQLRLYSDTNYAGEVRPNSFPTVGFVLLVPRFSHVTGGTLSNPMPMGRVLYKQWQHQGHSASGLARGYPLDFGHMPVFDNNQKVVANTYLAATADSSKSGVPWGQLVFDYFTTINPVADVNQDGVPDIDPLQIPGRININTAPWYVLSKLPLLGPRNEDGLLPILPPNDPDPDLTWPSPAFWDPQNGTFIGDAGYFHDTSLYTSQRQLTELALYSPNDYKPSGKNFPYWDNESNTHVKQNKLANDPSGIYRLGAWLAQAAASYRDGVQYLDCDASTSLGYMKYADSQLRNGLGNFILGGSPIPSISYRNALYGNIRGETKAAPNPFTQYGFVTIGELLNVKGFDSSLNVELPIAGNGLTDAATVVGRGDYLRAVSLLVLLDSQYLTTRSNTFTVYTSVMDREDPEASVRSQITVDRSNLLPRLSYSFFAIGNPAIPGDGTYYPVTTYIGDPNISQLPLVPTLIADLKDDSGNSGTNGLLETPLCETHADEEPRIIAQERVGYFNAQFDD